MTEGWFLSLSTILIILSTNISSNLSSVHGHTGSSTSYPYFVNIDCRNSISKARGAVSRRSAETVKVAAFSAHSKAIDLPSGVMDFGVLSEENPLEGYAVRPVVYLDSSVYIINGDGTEGNPYQIGM